MSNILFSPNYTCTHSSNLTSSISSNTHTQTSLTSPNFLSAQEHEVINNNLYNTSITDFKISNDDTGKNSKNRIGSDHSSSFMALTANIPLPYMSSSSLARTEFEIEDDTEDIGDIDFDFFTSDQSNIMGATTSPSSSSSISSPAFSQAPPSSFSPHYIPNTPAPAPSSTMSPAIAASLPTSPEYIENRRGSFNEPLPPEFMSLSPFEYKTQTPEASSTPCAANTHKEPFLVHLKEHSNSAPTPETDDDSCDFVPHEWESLKIDFSLIWSDIPGTETFKKKYGIDGRFLYTPQVVEISDKEKLLSLIPNSENSNDESMHTELSSDSEDSCDSDSMQLSDNALFCDNSRSHNLENGLKLAFSLTGLHASINQNIFTELILLESNPFNILNSDDKPLMPPLENSETNLSSGLFQTLGLQDDLLELSVNILVKFSVIGRNFINFGRNELELYSEYVGLNTFAANISLKSAYFHKLSSILSDISINHSANTSDKILSLQQLFELNRKRQFMIMIYLLTAQFWL